jgi:RecB family exonuclease
MATATVEQIGGLGEVLSPSQTKTLIGCAAKWYFKYVRGLPDVGGGALALGRAVHKVVKIAMQFKKLSKRDLPLMEAQKSFHLAFGGELELAELREDENAAELEATGEALVNIWMTQVAPTVQPKLIEHEVWGEIGGVSVRGFVDLVDQHGTIIDLKTTGRTPSEVDPDQVFQVATYRRLLPEASGRGRIDALVKNKTPKLVQLQFEVEDSDLQFVDRMYPLAQDVIRAGLYMPNRSCRVCSRKYCSFWRACEAEFGGTVKE